MLVRCSLPDDSSSRTLSPVYRDQRPFIHNICSAVHFQCGLNACCHKDSFRPRGDLWSERRLNVRVTKCLTFAYIRQLKKQKGAITLTAHRHNVNELQGNSTFLICALLVVRCRPCRRYTECFKQRDTLYLFVRCVCQGRLSYGQTNRDASYKFEGDNNPGSTI